MVNLYSKYTIYMKYIMYLCCKIKHLKNTYYEYSSIIPFKEKDYRLG